MIELLVVISIIGLLASAVLSSLSSAHAQANDARRLTDMRTLQTALELYFLKHDSYPTSGGLGCGSWETTGADATNGRSFVYALVSDGDMPTGMKDPTPSLEGSCGNYRYYRYPAGTNGCDSNRGAFYVLGITQTDKSGTAAYPTSPGWSCPTRNWQAEFSWVTGGFTN